MSLQNDRFLKALRREPVDQTPVWIMRQAGRYLPEYRETRAKAGDFLTLCKTPELACEVTMQPLARFPLDAAIVFSDILTIPDAMGLGLQFMQGEGPQFLHPVRDEQAIKSLRTPDMESLSYVFKAVSTIKSALNQRVPLIGFAGSPWTLACYMIEGHGSKDFHLAKSMLYRRPDLMHALLEKLATITIDYLHGQIEAGVDAIMLFDTWGGLLTTPTYPEFSLKYMQKIIRALPNCPSILFTKGGGQWLESMADTGASALGLDWTVDIKQARERVGSKVALQGNLDPAVLLADPKTIRQETQHILDNFGPGPGHIFNLGHGITPDVPPEHLGAVIEAVQSYRPFTLSADPGNQ